MTDAMGTAMDGLGGTEEVRHLNRRRHLVPLCSFALPISSSPSPPSIHSLTNEVDGELEALETPAGDTLEEVTHCTELFGGR
jgi:hypothetical protein